MISIVIPVHNEEENVAILHKKIVDVMTRINSKYEIIFVEDSSTDNTLAKLKTLSPVKIVVLSNKSSQTLALDAGIHKAEGDIIITMDGDLQNDPEDIPNLVKKINEGYDVVSGWRKMREDSSGRKLLSRLANWLTAKVSGLHMHDSACALKAYRKKIVQSVRLYGEMHVFLPVYLHGLGAKVTEIEVKHHPREHGISKHYFFKAVKDIFDLLTIKFLVTMTGRPMLFFGGIGTLSAFLGIVTALISIYLKIADIRNFGQTPLPILAVFLFLTGLILFMLGFLAELILRVYFETNKKTPYSIKEEIENQ
jgi:glycosyltransferase involved in cell wall biosynthesis